MSSNYWSSTTRATHSGEAWYVDFGYGFVLIGLKSYYCYVRAVRGGQSSNFFVDNGNGTVTDTSTGLMWQQATAGATNWNAAINYCEGLVLGGHSDWRLPNRNELQSLVDYSTYIPAIDATAFPNTTYSLYWSSTTLDLYSGSAWGVEFDDGDVAYNSKLLDFLYYVRAVIWE